MCEWCGKSLSNVRQFCDEACFDAWKDANSERLAGIADELPVGESRADTFDEPPEWDVAGGL
jgi:hypothetical protein